MCILLNRGAERRGGGGLNLSTQHTQLKKSPLATDIYHLLGLLELTRSEADIRK